MIYKNFILQVSLRFLLIFANMAVILVPVFKLPFKNVVFITLILSSLLLVQIYLLFSYLKQSHKLLNDVLKMLNAGQYLIPTPVYKGVKPMDELNKGINNAINSFREINNKYQSQLQYLELLIDKIDIGIFSVNKDGKIELYNKACEQILGVKKINHLSDISQKQPILAETIKQTEYDRHLLMDLKNGESTKQVSVRIGTMNIHGKYQKIATIHDISGDVVKTETEAWNRLLKILNHEIFNSVTPLSSLSNTLGLIIKNEKGEVKTAGELSDEEFKDIAESIEIIRQRSSNLMSFIEGFKKLAKVPPPKIEKISIDKLLTQVVLLFKNEAGRKKIGIKIKGITNFEINADQGQLEQAIINLISNSIYALENREDPRIELRYYTGDEMKHIVVSDNGCGIPKENLNQVFVPFYSTRKNGSGIGLSLAKYLIQLNNGTIEVKSEVNSGTSVTLSFD